MVKKLTHNRKNDVSKELTNDENLANLKKRKWLRWGIMLFGFATIILAFLNLFEVLHIGFAIGTFVITTIFVKMREKTLINKNEEIVRWDKEIAKAKKFSKGKIDKK